MLTGRDLSIVQFINEYGCLTAKQAAKIFFKNCNQAETLARRRFRSILKTGELLVYSDLKTNQKVYYAKKQPSLHTLKCLDVYAELVYYGADVLEFQREVKLYKCTPDAYIAFKIGNKGKMIFLEIDLYNKTNLEKYIPLFDSNEFQELYGIFPTIIIVSARPREIPEMPFKVVCLDFDLKGLIEYLSN